jgi:hypothetical protein
MSVPLDRLYHYLANVVNHDLIIYGWTTHGSRNLEDLFPLNSYSNFDFFHLPHVLAHDQEPLIYNYYDKAQIQELAKNRFQTHGPLVLVKEEVLDYYANWYLKAILSPVNKFDKTILLHSEKNSEQVSLFEQNAFVPVYYWSHAVIALDWFRFAEHDPNLVANQVDFDKDFLVYNRAWSGTREYRLYFTEQILQKNLLPGTNIKFSQCDSGANYVDHQFVNLDFAITDFDMHKKIQPNTALSSASADYTAHDYNTCAVEVVLETLFDDSRLHLTEKTLRPIACGKPFVLAATAGSLQYLRDYGFKTFSGLIDESYDTILNNRHRLDAVLAEMQRINNLDRDSKLQLFKQLHTIAKYNQTHFFNNLFSTVVQEYQQNLDQAMATMHQHCTGRHLSAVVKILKTIKF